MTAKPAKIRGIYLRGKTWWLARQRRGRRAFISLETSDYTEAVARATHIAHSPTINPTEGLRSDIEAFIAYQLKTSRYSRFSAAANRHTLLRFGESAGWPQTHKVTTDILQRHYNSLITRVSKPTAQTYMMVLRAFFKWAVKENIISRNPSASITFAFHDKTPRLLFCTAEQRDAIIANAPNDDLRFILYCGFHAGMRFNEISEARPEWFDLERNAINISQNQTFRTKSRKNRTVPLTKAFKTFLESYKPSGPYVLKPSATQRASVGAYRYSFAGPFRRYARAAGYPWLTPHVMRHSFASILAINRCDIFKIATWLGDNVLIAQRHYAHLLPSDGDIELLTARAQAAPPPSTAPQQLSNRPPNTMSTEMPDARDETSSPPTSATTPLPHQEISQPRQAAQVPAPV